MRGPRSNKKYTGKSGRIRNWFDANPTRWPEMTTKELMVAIGNVSYGLVRKIREEYGSEKRPYVRTTGVHAQAGRARPRETDPVDQLIPDAQVREIATNPTLDTEEKRRLLSDLARSLDTRTEGRIAAINALHKIDESVGSARELGPGPPLTQDERAERLGLLIAACGPETHARALALAQKEWDASPQVAET